MKWLGISIVVVLVGCGGHDSPRNGSSSIGLEVCVSKDVVVGCAGNTWPECARSCPPPDIDFVDLADKCAEPRGFGIQCDCLTGVCHQCEWGVDCHCDAFGTVCNP